MRLSQVVRVHRVKVVEVFAFVFVVVVVNGLIIVHVVFCRLTLDRRWSHPGFLIRSLELASAIVESFTVIGHTIVVKRVHLVLGFRVYNVFAMKHTRKVFLVLLQSSPSLFFGFLLFFDHFLINDDL